MSTEQGKNKHINQKDTVSDANFGRDAFHLTNTEALVQKIQANLVQDAKAEFAAVIQALNDSRSKDNDS